MIDDGASLDEANLVRANLYGANLDEANGVDGFFCFGPGGSRNSYTWARWEGRSYIVHCGCQKLTLKKFAEAVKEKHGDSYHAKWYEANIAVMELVAANSKEAHENRKPWVKP